MNWVQIDFEKIDSLIELMSILKTNNVPENDKWKYVSRYQDYKARLNGIPLSGQFELTPLCNLDCKMCYVHLNGEQFRNSELMSVDQWKEIMLQAHKMGMRHACLSGGECLTYPGFKELYTFLRDMGVTTTVKTNGVLIDQELLDFFDKYPPRDLNISLYGSSEESYEKVTGHRVFQKVADTLNYLRKVKYPVSISITPNVFIKDDIKDLILYAQKLGITYNINYGLFSPRENTGREIVDMSIDQYVDMILFYKKLNGSYPEVTEIIDLPDINKTSGNKRFGLQCAAGRSNFTVMWDGTLCACSNLCNISESLLTHNFDEAWKSVNQMAENYPLPSECPDCAYYPVCMQCIAYHNDLKNPGHCNPQICQKTKAYVRAGISKI